MNNLGIVPEGVAHTRFKNTALTELSNHYGYSVYPNGSPVLLITNTVPRNLNTGTDIIEIRLGNYPDNQVPHILNGIYRNLRYDDFKTIKWEERVKKLQETLPAPMIGTIASVISLL